MRRLPANRTADDRISTISFSRSGILLIILAGAILGSGALFHPVDGHSYYLNINWHAGFLAELRAGVWYPRWLSTTNQGLGAPSFYFYAPLPFYVSAVLHVVWPFEHGSGFPPAAAAVVSVIASGLAMFALIRALRGALIALPVAVVFMAMPYHFGADFWWRAAFGEIWAFVWLPLIMLGIVRRARGETGGALLSGAAAAGMILSHLPSFVIGACGLATLAGVALAAAISGRRELMSTVRVVAETALAIGIALLATAAYWYPALMTSGLTIMNEYMTQGWFDYRNNFILFSRPHKENGIPYRIVVGHMLLSILCIYVIARQSRTNSLPFLMACAVFALSLFMMTPFSAFLYELLPPLQRLQFPWRFLLLSEIALVVLLAEAIAAIGLSADGRVPKLQGMVAIALAAIVLTAVAHLSPVWMRPGYTPAERARADAYLKNRADGEEYCTRVTDFTFCRDITLGQREAPSAPRFIGEDGAAALSGARLRAGQLVFNQYWYPDFAVRDRVTRRDLPTMPQPITGLAMVEVSAGPYDLVAERRPKSEVTVAYRISLAGLLLALLWSGFSALSFRSSR
jgi:hypothetical protein